MLRIIYFIYILETPERERGHRPIYLPPDSHEYMFFGLTRRLRTAFRSLAEAAVRRPRFLGINDDIDDSDKGKLVSAAFRMLLGGLFPKPSGFETGRARGR